MMKQEPRRTLIQERRSLIREGLADLLDRDPHIEVVGAVATAAELVQHCEKESPDVVVLELDAPWDIREVIRDVGTHVPDVRVVALHGGRSGDHQRRSADAGVHALAAYGAGTEAIVARILDEPVVIYEGDDRREPKLRSALTPRELQVLRHLADGCTAAECAAALHVSRKTVDNHKQRIFSKLAVQNQAHAVAIAHHMGLLGRVPAVAASS